MLQRLGFVLIMLGVVTADSDSLVFPFVAVLIGSALILRAKGKEAEDGTE